MNAQQYEFLDQYVYFRKQGKPSNLSLKQNLDKSTQLGNFYCKFSNIFHRGMMPKQHKFFLQICLIMSRNCIGEFFTFQFKQIDLFPLIARAKLHTNFQLDISSFEARPSLQILTSGIEAKRQKIGPDREYLKKPSFTRNLVAHA